MKILGLTATYGLLNQIYTTMFTITAAVLQKFYSNTTDESTEGVDGAANNSTNSTL